MDFSKLSQNNQIAAGGAVMTLISGFLPWFSFPTIGGIGGGGLMWLGILLTLAGAAVLLMKVFEMQDLKVQGLSAEQLAMVLAALGSCLHVAQGAHRPVTLESFLGNVRQPYRWWRKRLLERSCRVKMSVSAFQQLTISRAAATIRLVAEPQPFRPFVDEACYAYSRPAVHFLPNSRVIDPAVWSLWRRHTRHYCGADRRADQPGGNDRRSAPRRVEPTSARGTSAAVHVRMPARRAVLSRAGHG